MFPFPKLFLILLKYFLKPMIFDEDTIPIDVMNNVGPGGNFLKEKHTRMHYRNFWSPRILDRKIHERWSQDGAKDLQEALNIQAKKIFEQHPFHPLPENKVQLIQKIVKKHMPDV